MPRAFRVAAGATLVAAVSLFSPLPALASATIMPAGPVPGGPDPDAPRLWSVWRSDGTARLLASVARVRADAGVDDYPARHTAGAEQAASPATDAAGGPPLTLILGGAGALVLLGGGAFVATRRRSRPPAHLSR